MLALLIGKKTYENNKLVVEEYISFSNLIVERWQQRFGKDLTVEPIIVEEISNLDKLQGAEIIVFTGGEDVLPEYYQAQVLYEPDLYSFNKDRDEIELETINKFYKIKPIFGICRGIQVINVFFKGSLFQHLPYDIKGISIENAHSIYPLIKNNEAKRRLRHYLLGNLFDKLSEIGYELVEINKMKLVNSRHHQGIKKLGQDLEILAISKDGVVEIVKHIDLPILAVQYHPEQKEVMKNQWLLIDYFLKLIY